MIRIYLGKLGSGKSLHAVKEMKHNKSKLLYHTNIAINFPRIRPLKENHIIEEFIGLDAKKKPKTDYRLNWGYWRSQKKPLHIIWDEIHLTASSRTSMSKKNLIMVEFVAMARRITGMDEAGYGTLTFIAQTDFSIEKYIRHLASEIIYHIMYWNQYCKDCGISERRNSEGRQTRNCNYCLSDNTKKETFFCVVYRFLSFLHYEAWSSGWEGKWYESKEVIVDIEEYFDDYDTLQEVSS